jgi:integrase
MGIIRDGKTGMFCARVKVPPRLEAAVAEVLHNGKKRQSWLKRSLGTKDIVEANKRAKAVLIEFDRVLAEAKARVEPPKLAHKLSLSTTEIERFCGYYRASKLAQYAERYRRLDQDEQDGVELACGDEWRAAQDALAASNLAYITDEAEQLLASFGIDLTKGSESWPAFLHALLQEHVNAYREMAGGELIAIPRKPSLTEVRPKEWPKLSAGLEGWKRSRERPIRTINEATRAVRLFTELHGDLEIAGIKRGHVRYFIDTLQNTPLRRSKQLRELKLADVSAWGAQHPEAPKISAASVNKLLGAVQAIVKWAALKGSMIPDDQPWSDPFASQRLEEDGSERTSFTTVELQTIFNRLGEFKQKRGASGFWLPVLAFYTGARQSELAGLTVENIDTESLAPHAVIIIKRSRQRRKRTKTKGSERVVPIHPELIRIGLLGYTSAIGSEHGPTAWLFPDIAPDNPNDAIGAWSTWFHAQIRAAGISDPNKVFHSFRHGMNDALISGGVTPDVRNALLGWIEAGMGGRYGAKELVTRFTIERLAEGIARTRLPQVTIPLYCAEA